MIENEPRTWPQSSRSIPDNQNIGVAFMSPLVMPLLSRPCNPVNYRAGTGAPCKQQEKNRRPVKGENLQRAFVIYLDGLTKSESRRPPNRHITGATTGVFSASTKRKRSGRQGAPCLPRPLFNSRHGLDRCRGIVERRQIAPPHEKARRGIRAELRTPS